MCKSLAFRIIGACKPEIYLVLLWKFCQHNKYQTAQELYLRKQPVKDYRTQQTPPKMAASWVEGGMTHEWGQAAGFTLERAVHLSMSYDKQQAFSLPQILKETYFVKKNNNQLPSYTTDYRKKDQQNDSVLEICSVIHWQYTIIVSLFLLEHS